MPLELYTSTYESNVLFQTVASSALRIVSTRTDTKSLLPIARHREAERRRRSRSRCCPRPCRAVLAPGMLVERDHRADARVERHGEVG